VAAGNIPDGQTGLHRRGNQGQFEFGGKASTARDARDGFDFRERIGQPYAQDYA